MSARFVALRDDGIDARGWSKEIAKMIGKILVAETKKELDALW